MNETLNPKKTPELVASIMRNGGKLLLVGDGVTDLPREITEHPQIILWDNSNGTLNQSREVPPNTKIIMYNRWVRHSISNKLDIAAKQLHALKFPMLRSREIKELLMQFTQADALPISPDEVNQQVESIISDEPESTEPISKYESDMPNELGEQINKELEVIMANVKKNSRPAPLKDFIIKHIDLKKEYGKKGTMAEEARRLMEKAKSVGLKTTIGSMNQCIYTLLKEIKLNKSKPEFKSEHGTPASLAAHVKVKVKSTTTDDFEQLDKMVDDAIAALKLIQEHLPKVRKETERLRSMKAKVMALFGE
jgi:hypothetical protein